MGGHHGQGSSRARVGLLQCESSDWCEGMAGRGELTNEAMMADRAGAPRPQRRAAIPAEPTLVRPGLRRLRDGRGKAMRDRIHRGMRCASVLVLVAMVAALAAAPVGSAPARAYDGPLENVVL